jgi:hypothetical protein
MAIRGCGREGGAPGVLGGDALGEVADGLLSDLAPVLLFRRPRLLFPQLRVHHPIERHRVPALPALVQVLLRLRMRAGFVRVLDQDVFREMCAHDRTRVSSS